MGKGEELTTTKYLIHAQINANGIVEKPDVVGAVFGQTEGLLSNDLDLRELQRTGRIGRIQVMIHRYYLIAHHFVYHHLFDFPHQDRSAGAGIRHRTSWLVFHHLDHRASPAGAVCGPHCEKGVLERSGRGLPSAYS